MRRNDPRRRYEQPPEKPVDYNRDLHDCKACGTTLQLDTARKRDEFFVVTRCRCDVYSTEAGPYATQGAATLKRRRLLAALPGDDFNERYIYRSGAYWSVEIKRKNFRYVNRCKSKALAIALRDQALLEAA